MKKSPILFSLVLIQCVLFAQQPAYKWSKAIGTAPNSMASSTGRDIICDANNNVYIVGYFDGALDFDPGTGVQTQTSNGLQDVFLAKTDSSGNLLWVKCFGGAGTDVGNAISIDNNGDIYVAGSFSLNMDFDPGASVATCTALSQRDCFISKFDASGNFIWVKNFEGSGDEEILSIALDNSGNIGAVGQFSGIIDFDPSAAVATYTYLGGTDGFALKLNSSGSFLWARTYGAWTTLYGTETARDLTFDNTGNLLVIGDFQYNVDFDPGTAYVPMIAGCSIASFLVKLDVNGSLVWVKSFGGQVGAYGNSVGIDNNGNIIVAGTMGIDDPFGDFDPGPGTYTLTTNGIQDVYVAKIDNAGNFLWARNFGGGGMDFVKNLAIDRNNNIVTTGEFFTNADFNPSPLAVATMSPIGGGDNFISVLTAAGNYLWAGQLKGYSTSYMENANAVYAASNGALYATGVATGGTDFDPSPATATITGFGRAAYALKFYEACLVPAAPSDANIPAKKKICVNAAANLSVSATGSVSWYSAPVSTVVIGSGTAIPVSTGSVGIITYYAAVNTCSQSPRTAITVTISACTDITEDNQLTSFLVAPNPASNELVVNLQSTAKIEISICDLAGKVLKHEGLPENGTLNISDLPPGIYLIEASVAEKKLYHKLVIAR